MHDLLNTDLYEALGVANDATDAEITTAYKKLARQHHPDLNPDDPEAEDRFKEIGAAYDVLHDPEKRAEYDQFRAMVGQGFAASDTAGGAPRAPWGGGGVDFNDLLTHLFGGGAGPGAGGPMAYRGADIGGRITLSFADALRGTTVGLSLPDGSTVEARIPAGVDDGQTVRLPGRGLPGVNGGPHGDLLLDVEVLPDHRFTRTGHDLEVRVTVDYPTAVLGGTAAVPTFDGPPVTIKVPAGTQPGRTFRLRGRGVRTAAATGDLLATVEINVPTDLSPEQRHAVEALADLL